MKLPLSVPFVVVVAAASTLAGCASLPAGDAGGADALAHRVEAWVNKPAWDQTGAVRFAFRKKRVHTWDKQRDLLDVKDGDLEVKLDLRDRGGFAERSGVELHGDDLTKALDDAWKWYCNDTFWLNPLVKLFDPGTSRAIVTLDGKRGLKVTYASGGVTPGDSYVWLVDDDGKPDAVRMWVSVIPLKGITFSWEGWQTLSTGAKVATNHASAGMDHAVTLDDVEGAADAKALGVDALFAPLVARRAGAAPAR